MRWIFTREKIANFNRIIKDGNWFRRWYQLKLWSSNVKFELFWELFSLRYFVVCAGKHNERPERSEAMKQERFNGVKRFIVCEQEKRVKTFFKLFALLAENMMNYRFKVSRLETWNCTTWRERRKLFFNVIISFSSLSCGSFSKSRKFFLGMIKSREIWDSSSLLFLDVVSVYPSSGERRSSHENWAKK